MTDFTTIEQSVASGKPVELFDLAMGTEHWYLTSAGYDITYLYHTYESAPCQCTELSQSSEGGSDDMELEIPRGHALAVMCVAGPPDQQVSLTIYHGHDPYYHKYYTGYLNNFKFNANSIPALIFGSASSDMPMKGGRRRAMKQCDLKLYGFRCGVNKTAHEITGTIDTIDGVTITSTAFGAVATMEPEVYGDITDLTGSVYNSSSNFIGHQPSWAFNNTVVPWQAQTNTNEWISVQFSYPKFIKKIKILPRGAYSPINKVNVRYFKIQASNDGTIWSTIDVIEWSMHCNEWTGGGGHDTEMQLQEINPEWISVILDTYASYLYWRVYIVSGWGGYFGSGGVSVAEIEMIEADNSLDLYQFAAGGSIVVGNAERTIIYHNGDTAIINRPFRTNVAAGDSFRAYRGCDHTASICREIFENIINYGGRQHMPVKNPYTGRNTLVT